MPSSMSRGQNKEKVISHKKKIIIRVPSKTPFLSSAIFIANLQAFFFVIH